jgi:hypothetical protein
MYNSQYGSHEGSFDVIYNIRKYYSFTLVHGVSEVSDEYCAEPQSETSNL